MNDRFKIRIAKDGKPFDEDNVVEDVANDEVEVIQFLRPSAKRRRILATVGKELAEKARNLILSIEVVESSTLCLYARRIGEAEETEKTLLVENGPGLNSPENVLKKLIEEMDK